MKFGMRLRELWQHRLGLTISLAIALFAGFWSIAHVSLLPPRVESRHLEIASANTRVLVDMPKSLVLDLSEQVADIESLTNRALLVGNLIGSAPVRESIARRVGIPADRLQVAAPLTREWPRAMQQAGTKRSTSDILRSPDEYRINVRANPTVPVLEISTVAPTAADAARLANGAVLGTEDYLRSVAAREAIAPARQTKLEQLGVAKGGVINQGVSVKVALLSFLLTLTVSCIGVLALARIRAGWASQAAAAKTPPVGWENAGA
jgi:hypothetical protein